MKQGLPAPLPRVVAALEERKRIAEAYKHQDMQAHRNYEQTRRPLAGISHRA